MKKVKIWIGTTKGELMKICYDNDEKKLAMVDTAIPTDMSKDMLTYWYVMDYNKNIFGELRNLKDVAKENNIELIY